MEIAIGILIGIGLVIAIRLLELKSGITTQSLDQLTKLPHGKAEIILPESTPEDIMDTLVKESAVIIDNNPLR